MGETRKKNLYDSYNIILYTTQLCFQESGAQRSFRREELFRGENLPTST